jgi:imidazolonepropionase-like amidohydrolase
MTLSRWASARFNLLILAGALLVPGLLPADTLFKNVRVLNTVNGTLSSPTNVMVRGNKIDSIGPAVTAEGVQAIDGQGKTLMPGLIDVHVHLTFSSMLLSDLYSPETTPEIAAKAAAKGAGEMLLRGFTAVRDVGGPIFPLKRAIDAGKTPGPRVWPAGANISQTSGHGDYRTVDEPSRRFSGKQSRAEEYGATFIADGRDEVLTATRENLRQGASQIKLMAGGGTSSVYDPLDVTQYTLDEMKAAVEAAADWGTYVTVHAYTPKAVRRAIEAGVKCVEHGQLLDEPTIQLMAQKGVWLSAQNLIRESPNMTEERRVKRLPVIRGNERIWPLAKKYGVKVAWGTDLLFEPELNGKQNELILELKPWYSPAGILKMITYDNAQLLALSGLRSPYEGKLGVVEKGALADLLLVDGDPLANIDLLANPGKNFVVIMKDGAVVKGN